MANREIVDKNQQVDVFLNKRKLRNAFVISFAVGIFIGFLAPFGMDEIPMLWSMTYWVIVCLIGYFIYMPTIFFGNRLLAKILPARWCRIALGAFVASILMSFIIPVITWFVFSAEINFAIQFVELFPKVIVIGGVLTFSNLLHDYLKRQKDDLIALKNINETHEALNIKNTNQNIEAFMALLPLDKRGELICLEMADHYVKVYTDKGHHLLLMRFKDALAKLTKYSGIQTHRSWWVALNAVTAVNKEGRKTSLLLINNIEVPVSRTYADNVKTANIH